MTQNSTPGHAREKIQTCMLTERDGKERERTDLCMNVIGSFVYLGLQYSRSSVTGCLSSMGGLHSILRIIKNRNNNIYLYPKSTTEWFSKMRCACTMELHPPRKGNELQAHTTVKMNLRHDAKWKKPTTKHHMVHKLHEKSRIDNL